MRMLMPGKGMIPDIGIGASVFITIMPTGWEISTAVVRIYWMVK